MPLAGNESVALDQAIGRPLGSYGYDRRRCLRADPSGERHCSRSTPSGWPSPSSSWPLFEPRRSRTPLLFAGPVDPSGPPAPARREPLLRAMFILLGTLFIAYEGASALPGLREAYGAVDLAFTTSGERPLSSETYRTPSCSRSRSPQRTPGRSSTTSASPTRAARQPRQ